jgi:hypothetical protein
LDARGLGEGEIMDGARGTMDELAEATIEPDKVLAS